MINNKRDCYIDFLRGFGLLLLIVAHTWAPDIISSIRTFDVPLMVFVSALCYKPIEKNWESYKKYISKRFVRIYIPVFVFINLLFSIVAVFFLTGVESSLSISQYIGSLLLLNYPSIGYVWIMRVFLLIALILPLIHPIIKKLSFRVIVIALILTVFIQDYFIDLINVISIKLLKYILSEFLLYLIGYSLFAILGIKLNNATRNQILTCSLILLLCCILNITITNNFDPQIVKYPPHNLYLFYGMFGCCTLWYLKPILIKISTFNFWRYLSNNSMWLYLWHIIPVFLITPLQFRPNNWIIRYTIVFFGALFLNALYHILISKLPLRIKRILS